MITLALEAVHQHFSDLVDKVVRTHQRIEVIRDGRRAAVILSADVYDSLMETLDVLGDPEAMAGIREADADVAAGRVYSLEEVETDLRARGILSR